MAKCTKEEAKERLEAQKAFDEDLSEEYRIFMNESRLVSGKKATIDFCKGQLRRQLDKIKNCDEVIDALDDRITNSYHVDSCERDREMAIQSALTRAFEEFRKKEGY